jgi:DNA-directed RNA polymerase subunit RPC12/RpoP
MKCVACGGERLVEGKVSAGHGTDDLSFRPADGSYLKAMLGLDTRHIRAYGCARCGHLQLAVELSEEDLRRFLEFEGQQPTVLERLNEEQDDPEGRSN